jgi:hypothetical protein
MTRGTFGDLFSIANQYLRRRNFFAPRLFLRGRFSRAEQLMRTK